MRTAPVYRKLLSFISSGLGDRIASVAADYGVEAPLVKHYELGWRDPFNLSAYNAVFLVPDHVAPDRQKVLARVSVAMVAAIRGSSIEALTDAMLVYSDAIPTLFEDDPTAGGAVFEVLVDDIDLSLPASGSAPVGVVTVLMTVSADQMST